MKKRSVLFFLMFLLLTLLSTNFTILRNLRSTLTVIDLGNGARSIPLFELCGTLPGALILTALISKLLGKLKIEQIFLTVLTLFLLFFLTFAFFLYPVFGPLYPKATALSFHAFAELWKIGLISLLFWGLLNRSFDKNEAFSFYSTLFLATSFGAILGGQFTKFCAHAGVNWKFSLLYFSLILTAIGIICGLLYLQLAKRLSPKFTDTKSPFSLPLALKSTFQSRYLFLLALIVFSDYIAYTLSEVLFLDVLKLKFPDPKAYCSALGNLSFWAGILTTVSALFVAPLAIKKGSWLSLALITPLCLLFTAAGFLGALLFKAPLSFLVACGSLQYILCRATKYTLFDASKELAYVALPYKEKMEGKLAIDGLIGRFGRGSGSLLSLSLLSLNFAPFALSSCAMVLTLLWISATWKLGRIKALPTEHVAN